MYTNISMIEGRKLNSLQVPLTDFTKSKKSLFGAKSILSDWWLSRDLDYKHLFVAEIGRWIHAHAADVNNIMTADLLGVIALEKINSSDEVESDDK